jgi:hypothetical protein
LPQPEKIVGKDKNAGKRREFAGFIFFLGARTKRAGRPYSGKPGLQRKAKAKKAD